MSRLMCLSLMLLCLLAGLSQSWAIANQQPSSTPVQVVYLQDGLALTTYNVDPQTLYATQVGQPFNLPVASFNLLIPSLNGEFLYILGNDSTQTQHLWVFATDASGVPQGPPVQKLNAGGLYDFQLDPSGKFAYAIVGLTSPQGQTLYQIRRFTVDSTTGKLSSPVVVAKYPFNGPCLSGAEGASPDLNGFAANGQTLYDSWYCNYHDNYGATYYTRTVNLQTGELGPEVEVYTWNNGTQGYDTVSFSHNRVVDFSIPNNWQQGASSLTIYPVVPNSTRPMLQCTASMLEACGYSLGEIVHPSGQYIFFVINYYTDQIAKIDPAARTLVDTTHYIPYQVAKFNPEGTIAYALNVQSSAYYVEIYGFDPATADVTTNGGTILAPSILDTFWPVDRR